MKTDYLKSLETNFRIDETDIKKIISNFHFEMQRGLRGDKSSLKMLPAYIDSPKGTEAGKFIALDFGGTNFRTLEVHLNGKGGVKLKHSEKFVIPKAVMHGTGTQLFNFIAQSIKKFVLNYNIGLADFRKLGFTFSFPLKQHDIVTGILIKWTKDFSASGVVGENVVKLLSEALKNYNLSNIKIVALANDTVGTMAARAYKDNDCDMGVIFGTGTNGCYREKIVHIRKMKSSGKKRASMIINIEWGNFDKLPMNEYDIKLDASTNNPKQQIMEKMISGMYLGELTRLVLSEMIKKKYIFHGMKAKIAKGDFKSSHMSLIEGDKTRNLSKVEEYLESIGIYPSTIEDRKLLKNICKIVSTRAARISAAAISAVITKMDPKLKNHHTVAIDGTLYERYPGFRKKIISTLREMHGEKSSRISPVLSKDGSGIGVAIAAAVASVGKS